jgi:acetoin utilization deacetylase AcuC-like enzyme
VKAVVTDRHRAHDPKVETYLGVPVPANEVPERAEVIRAALAADGGFELQEPTDHGLEPILAVHDAGLVRFMEEAWPEVERQRIDREFLVADTYPVRNMFEGMSEEAIAARPEPVAMPARPNVAHRTSDHSTTRPPSGPDVAEPAIRSVISATTR